MARGSARRGTTRRWGTLPVLQQRRQRQLEAEQYHTEEAIAALSGLTASSTHGYLGQGNDLLNGVTQKEATRYLAEHPLAVGYTFHRDSPDSCFVKGRGHAKFTAHPDWRTIYRND